MELSDLEFSAAMTRERPVYIESIDLYFPRRGMARDW